MRTSATTPPVHQRIHGKISSDAIGLGPGATKRREACPGSDSRTRRACGKVRTREQAVTQCRQQRRHSLQTGIHRRLGWCSGARQEWPAESDVRELSQAQDRRTSAEDCGSIPGSGRRANVAQVEISHELVFAEMMGLPRETCELHLGTVYRLSGNDRVLAKRVLRRRQDAPLRLVPNLGG